MNRIPISETPGQAIAITVALDNSSPYVFGPNRAGFIIRNMVHKALHVTWTALAAVLNAAAWAGLVIGAVMLLNLALMFAWPSWGRYVEQAVWYAVDRVTAAEIR